jgi:hypothetical protein
MRGMTGYVDRRGCVPAPRAAARAAASSAPRNAACAANAAARTSLTPSRRASRHAPLRWLCAVDCLPGASPRNTGAPARRSWRPKSPMTECLGPPDLHQEFRSWSELCSQASGQSRAGRNFRVENTKFLTLQTRSGGLLLSRKTPEPVAHVGQPAPRPRELDG